MNVRTGLATDFWRETFYGFRRDNGHFLFQRVESDFSAEVTIQGQYEMLYDQARLMLQLSETHWIKAGIEYSDGLPCISVVITNTHSDWSLMRLPADEGAIRIRLTRHHEALRVQVQNPTRLNWLPVRLGYLPPTSVADVGLMCCSPERAGFQVTFSDFTLGPAISRDLHG